MINNFTQTVVALAALLASITVIVKFVVPIVRKIKALSHSVNNFFLDWAGEEARPGRDAIPGVMERLNAIDGQLKNNGGSTIKDAVDRIERRVNRIDERLAEGDQDFETIYNEMEVIKHMVERRREEAQIDFPDRRAPRAPKPDTDSTQQ